MVLSSLPAKAGNAVETTMVNRETAARWISRMREVRRLIFLIVIGTVLNSM
jgi:hypothetical protein